MNRADVVIVLAAVAFLVVGWRRGLVRSLLAFVGLLLGMAIGIAVVPPLLVRWDMSVWISMAAILVVGGSALLVHWLLLQLDARAREVIRWRVDGVLDRLGGAFFGVGAALMSSWMLGLAFTASALPGLSEPAKGSLVLRQMDRMDLPMSHLIVKWFSRLGEDVDFSRYLDPLTSERIVDVPAPPPGIVETPEIVASGGGVARITSLTGPASGQEGTGFWIAPGRLMTAAHVVNGASRITVEHSFARHDAQVVVCDPELDAAVLDVSGGGGLPLRWANAWPRLAVAMPGFPDNQFRIVPGRIRSEERLPEAGTEGKGSRTVWALRAEVLPGQSGGPVVDVRGNVVGMVVLNSRTHPDLAYALTRAELSEVWAVGRHKAPGREPRCR